MSADDNATPPARKVQLDELMGTLAERNEKVPALTSRALAVDFPDVERQTVGNNLDDLAKTNKICRYYDSNVKIYWYPREQDEAGTVEQSELFDDSIDWEDVDVSTVPIDVAKDIASERIPFYRPRSFWSEMKDSSQIGIIATFGLVVLGLGELVAGSFGLGQTTGALLLQWGLRLAFVALVGWVIFIILDILAAQGWVPIDPRSIWRGSD